MFLLIALVLSIIITFISKRFIILLIIITSCLDAGYISYGLIKVRFFEIALLSLTVLWLIENVCFNRKFFMSWTLTVLGLFIITNPISLFLQSTNMLTGIINFVHRFGLYLLSLFLFQHLLNPRYLKIALNYFVKWGTFLCSYGLAQWIISFLFKTGFGIPNINLSIGENNLHLRLSGSVQYGSTLGYFSEIGRPSAVFIEAVNFGQFVGWFFVFVLFLQIFKTKMISIRPYHWIIPALLIIPIGSRSLWNNYNFMLW